MDVDQVTQAIREHGWTAGIAIVLLARPARAAFDAVIDLVRATTDARRAETELNRAAVQAAEQQDHRVARIRGPRVTGDMGRPRLLDPDRDPGDG